VKTPANPARALVAMLAAVLMLFIVALVTSAADFISVENLATFASSDTTSDARELVAISTALRIQKRTQTFHQYFRRQYFRFRRRRFPVPRIEVERTHRLSIK